MNPEQFLKEFNTFINAPNGIQQLRNLIVELAVEGEFDEHDASDEDVASLLEDIHAQREDLLAKRIIRKERSPSSLNELEKPFEINKNWVWTRLGDLAWPLSGAAFKSEYFNDQGIGKAIIRIGNLSQTKDQIYYSGEFDPRYLVNKGEYLVGMSGEFKVAQWQSQASLLNQRVARLIFFDKRINRYFVAMSLQMRLSHLHKGYSFTTLKNLSLSDLCDSVIALPPLEEQERIVARVDELMELCDRLEEEQQAAEAFSDELRVSTFHHLIQPEKPKDKQDALQILIEESGLLLTKPEDVKQLRNLIMDLAIQGSLTKRGSEISNVNELVDLAVEGKLLNESYKFSEYSDNVDTDNGNFFRIPESWEWVPAVDIGQFIRGVTYKKSVTQDTPKDGFMPVLRANNIGRIMNYDNLVYIPDGNIKDNQILKRGDWLICTASGSKRLVGKNAAFKGSELMTFGAFNCAYRLNEPDLYPFIKVFFKSRIYRGFVFDEGTGMTINNLKISSLKKIQFPIPSLNEQERIVARVDELMELCDQLEEELSLTVGLSEEYVLSSSHHLVS
jgi:type I restriction enzyme, S subunit